MRPHGTITRYLTQKCRCDLCRQARSDKGRLEHQANGEAIRARVRAWRAANPDKVKAFEQARSAYKKAYYLANRDAIKATHAAYRIANRDARLRTNAIYDEAHREETRLRGREWRKANPTKTAEHWRVRRARELSEAFVVTDRDWRRLCDRYDNRCAYCRKQEFLERDHVVPLSRGGRHSIGNLLPACRSCNGSKNKKLLVEWRAFLQVLGRAS